METVRFTARRSFVVALLLAGSAYACGGKPGNDPHSSAPALTGNPTATSTSTPTSTPTSSATAIPTTTPSPTTAGLKYPGTGFRVHEWGTNTIVVGSDGSLQRGLQHEEEDLPAFVYDRRKAGEAGLSVAVKMETPVTYFYADHALSVHAAVQFPQGVLTQWFPQVTGFMPELGHRVDGLTGPIGDPALDPSFTFANSACAARHAKPAGGQLDWGSVDVLARGASSTLLDAPLAKFTWSHAREVDSNAIRLGATGESEKFLFYRGLGDFLMNVRVETRGGVTSPDTHVHLTNLDGAASVGTVFVLDVTDTGGAFTVHPEGIAAGGTLDELVPQTLQSLDAYAASLSDAMVAALDRSGLYRDEALAMVHTWQRQWFRTPGVRVLYLAPQAWTEAQIPLVIDPKPEEMTRVMVIRVEAITPDQEQLDMKQASGLTVATDDPIRAYFLGLGRFAEPRLRRAIANLGAGSGTADANALLATLQGADVNGRVGE